MIAAAALAALLASSVSRAADSAAAPDLQEMAPSRSSPGWTRQANSLLLYGTDGSLAQELPLKAPDENATNSRETIGGASPDGRLAWTLDRRLVFSPGRIKLLESHRMFKLYGSDGAELWHDDAVDKPERGQSVLFSADGQVLMFARHGDDGWSAEARDWMGKTLAAAGPFPRLISLALTPNGRFALARWAVPDKSDTHTFLDLKTKARKDVESSDLLLGLARIGDDGVVRSGSKTIYSFPIEVSSATAPSPAAAP